MLRKSHPDQIMFDWSRDAQMERIIEARVALRAGLTVAVACLLSGLLLIGLSAGCGQLLSRYRRWRAR